MAALDPAPQQQAAPQVRALLEAFGFQESAMLELFGLTDPSGLGRVGRAVLAWRAREAAPLACLCRLFMLEQAEAQEQAERLLGKDALTCLLQGGLLQLDAGQVRPTLALRPWGKLLLASDLRAAHQRGCDEFVLGPGPVARMLAGMALPGRHGRVLDLGTGCGVLACQLADTVEQVVATDLSPRALAFARFNADLNGLNNIEFRQGDLFAPVAGERFDLVLCNPPMVISPDARYLYRDGGSEISARIVAEASAHLTPDGVLQMLCNWPERRGSDWNRVPARWLDAGAVDGWLLRLHSLQAATYADVWLRQQPGSGEPDVATLTRWVEHLAAQGGDAVGGGLLMLRPGSGATPIRVFRDAPPMDALPGAALARWLEGLRWLQAQQAAGRDLLDLPLRPAAGARMLARRQWHEHGQSRRQWRLEGPPGLAFSLPVDANLAAMLERLDGRLTLRQAAHAHARSLDVDPARPLAALPELAHALLERGLLVPAR